MRQKRIFFIGDELIAGQGDARALGWTGRVLARTITDPPLLSIHLPFPGETTEHLANRWQNEVAPRMNREDDHYLVIGLGSHDLDSSTSTARSRLHLANLLDNAERLECHPFVVGPPPRPDRTERQQIELTQAFAEVCERREIPFVDTYSPLIGHEQWQTDMSMTHSYTPRQAGYALIAWLVVHKGWHAWLGASQLADGH